MNHKPISLSFDGTQLLPIQRFGFRPDQLNGCAAEGSPWGEHCTLFVSASGTPAVEFIHPGGHDYPRGTSAAIARFFKEHPKK